MADLSSKLKIGFYQFEPKFGDINSNLDKVIFGSSKSRI